MVDDSHAERLGLLLEVAPNSPHAQNPEDLALGVVAECGEGLAPPFPFAEGLHACVEVAQRTDDQEHVHVGGCVVHSCGDVGDAQGRIASAAGVDIDLVVSGAWKGGQITEIRFVEERQATLPQCARKLTERGSALTSSSSMKPVMVMESKVL